MTAPPQRSAATGRRVGTRGAANTDALLTAARRLVLEKGGEFTTQELIKEADVALQTFYRHFGGKDQILVAVVGDLVRGFCEALEREVSSTKDPIQRLRFCISSTLNGFSTAESRASARFMTSQHWRLQQSMPEQLAAANQPFADLLQGEIERGVTAGVMRSTDPGRDARLINQLVMAAFHALAFSDAEEPTKVANDVWGFCSAAVGIAPQPQPPVKSARTQASSPTKA